MTLLNKNSTCSVKLEKFSCWHFYYDSSSLIRTTCCTYIHTYSFPFSNKLLFFSTQGYLRTRREKVRKTVDWMNSSAFNEKEVISRNARIISVRWAFFLWFSITWLREELEIKSIQLIPTLIWRIFIKVEFKFSVWSFKI